MYIKIANEEETDYSQFIIAILTINGSSKIIRILFLLLTFYLH